jgi:hypothetical protein
VRRLIRPLLAFVCSLSIEDTDATNEFINDDRVHPLSTQEIEALKTAGVHASASIYINFKLLLLIRRTGNYSKANRTARCISTQERVQQG